MAKLLIFFTVAFVSAQYVRSINECRDQLNICKKQHEIGFQFENYLTISIFFLLIINFRQGNIMLVDENNEQFVKA